MRISLLEDDDEQAELQTQWLSECGYDVKRFANCKDFLAGQNAYLPDLIILDWELPDGTGIEVLETLKRQSKGAMPILFTTQRDSEEDIVRALTKGADDYLVKPLRHKEYVARLHALCRRAGIKESTNTIKEGIFKIDTLSQTVYRSDMPIKLTRKDYLVCSILFDNVGKAISRDHLLQSVWGTNSELDTRTVDVHVSRVRRSLKLGPESGYFIKTIYQHGYRLEKITEP